MLASKVTSKYQATIPTNIRKFLHLKQGDKVAFQIKNDKVVLKKLKTPDIEYLQSMSDTLSEWNSTEDDEAYDNL